MWQVIGPDNRIRASGASEGQAWLRALKAYPPNWEGVVNGWLFVAAVARAKKCGYRVEERRAE